MDMIFIQFMINFLIIKLFGQYLPYYFYLNGSFLLQQKLML